ncbi:MAG: hypothetical protein C4522_21620 [Desulfobacteraceae bacterium]|nr:MAG: hypothetical protein C4522_21620 [Desulfobacteraceae bacterium]
MTDLTADVIIRREILTFPESRTFLRQAIRQTQEKYSFRIDALVLRKEDALKSISYQAVQVNSGLSIFFCLNLTLHRTPNYRRLWVSLEEIF